MKLKKWLLGLVTFAAMVVLCAVCAGAETYGDFEYSVLDDGTVKLTDYNGSAEKVDIPKMIDGKSVTSIKYNAFRGCTSLKSITIPNSVTEIGDSAFDWCTSLTSITIPKNVTSIGKLAFADCTSLTSITIPKNVTSIGKWAFENCTSLTSITIPDGVTEIGWTAFQGCTSLTSITIPNSVTSIGARTFYRCTSLTSITIPKNVTSIGKLAFADCTSLTSITIPKNVTSIGKWAFENCTSLTSITIPDGVTEIGWSAFQGCTSLTSITIPDSVKNIGEHAFGYNYNYDNGYKKIDNFKIYCYSGTAGERYAKENGFEYVLLDKLLTLAKVTGFKVKSIFSTNVTLQWNKNANASGYEIEQYKSGKWTNVAKITSNATTSYTVKGLKAGTAGYQFRIRAYRTEGKNKAYSGYSATVKVNTNPYGVGGFKCSSKTSTSVTLKWNKGTTASGYQLQQYKDGKWVTIYTGTKATNTSFTVKKLKAGTAGYRFRIRAYKTYGNTKQYGSWSSEVKVNTNPYGVGGFKAKSTAKNSITLGWNKGTTASGYQLQQYKGGKWVTVYTGTKATSTSYTVKSLKANTSYKFRIRAYKTYGNTKQYGSWSKELTVRTKR